VPDYFRSSSAVATSLANAFIPDGTADIRFYPLTAVPSPTENYSTVVVNPTTGIDLVEIPIASFAKFATPVQIAGFNCIVYRNEVELNFGINTSGSPITVACFAVVARPSDEVIAITPCESTTIDLNFTFKINATDFIVGFDATGSP